MRAFVSRFYNYTRSHFIPQDYLMNTKLILAVYLILSAPILCAGRMADIVKNSGIKGGIVVHLGCGDGKETAEMLLKNSYLVYGLDTSADNITKARAYLHSKILYG